MENENTKFCAWLLKFKSITEAQFQALLPNDRGTHREEFDLISGVEAHKVPEDFWLWLTERKKVSRTDFEGLGERSKNNLVNEHSFALHTQNATAKRDAAEASLGEMPKALAELTGEGGDRARLDWVNRKTYEQWKASN